MHFGLQRKKEKSIERDKHQVTSGPAASWSSLCWCKREISIVINTNKQVWLEKNKFVNKDRQRKTIVPYERGFFFFTSEAFLFAAQKYKQLCQNERMKSEKVHRQQVISHETLLSWRYTLV